jgi:cytochrome c oxidase cbb3-type subunit 3
MTTLEPGRPGVPSFPESPYQDKAWHVAEGQKLFSNFNCVGCHAHGGGGMGPPLMDAEWIYGADPRQIFASIVEGRPNGMPAFGGKVPEMQVWQLVAYVQSLGGHVPMDAAPGRTDHMSAKPPEMSLPEMPRVQSGTPPPGSRKQ